MIQLCMKSIEPPKLLSKIIPDEETFLEDRKNINIVPIHKKESKNLIKGCRPIGFLPVFSNIYERLTFNYLFKYVVKIKLFTEFQFDFIPGNSCTAQQQLIKHEIFKSFLL